MAGAELKHFLLTVWREPGRGKSITNTALSAEAPGVAERSGAWDCGSGLNSAPFHTGSPGKAGSLEPQFPLKGDDGERGVSIVVMAVMTRA